MKKQPYNVRVRGTTVDRNETAISPSLGVDDAIAMEDRAARGRYLERRWSLISFLFLLLFFYMQTGSTYSLFAFTIEYAIGEDMNNCIWAMAIAVGLFFVPMLLRRRGILSDTRKLRTIIVGSALAAGASIIMYSVYYAVLIEPIHLWPGIVLECLIVVLPSLIAGCVLHRAVMVMNIKTSAVFAGMVFLCVYVLYWGDSLFYAVFLNDNTIWAALLSYYPIIYTILIGIAVAVFLTTDDDPTYAAPEPDALFANALFIKFVLLAIILVLFDNFSQVNYYLGADLSQYAKRFVLMFVATFIPTFLVITWLLQRGKWMLALALSTILYCFVQGMELFLPDGELLGYAYATGCMVFGACNTVFMLYIPLVLCIQRRNGANILTGIIGIGSLLQPLYLLIRMTFFSDVPEESVVMPAVAFALSLAMIGYLFYLYSENGRIKVGELQGEIDILNTPRVAETVPQEELLQGLGLTPREREVCLLLLKSFTIRQISGELHLAFATVNSYYRSLYRKLGINSKAELFMRFGADIKPGREDD